MSFPTMQAQIMNARNPDSGAHIVEAATGDHADAKPRTARENRKNPAHRALQQYLIGPRPQTRQCAVEIEK
jgi:hypothetical protein